MVADGLGWANECVVSGDKLFVNETFSRRLTSFSITENGDLVNRETVTTFGAGTYPDGLSLDEEGGFWVISVASNRIIRVMPSGEQHQVLHDEIPEQLEHLEKIFLEDRLTRGGLTSPIGKVLRNISSIAFGGPDRRTAFLGSIGGDRIGSFRVPVAGARPVHWDW